MEFNACFSACRSWCSKLPSLASIVISPSLLLRPVSANLVDSCYKVVLRVMVVNDALSIRLQPFHHTHSLTAFKKEIESSLASFPGIYIPLEAVPTCLLPAPSPSPLPKNKTQHGNSSKSLEDTSLFRVSF